MSKNNVTVQTSLMPFTRVFKTITLEDCKTIKDVINATAPLKFAEGNLIITLNGEKVCGDWENLTLKEGDLVGLNVIPTGGGGGGGKDMGVQIAVMAVVAVATVYTGGAAATAFAAGNYGTALAWSAATIGVSMIGTMAAQALMSTPKQSYGTNNGSETQTKFIEGARNDINKYGVVPINLGTNRIFPCQAALPYSENGVRDQYIRQLFTYGYGKLLITDKKFGETEFSNFSEVEFEDKLNGDLNTGTRLYTNDIYQENLNVALTNSAGYILRTTQSDSDEMELDVTFQGLCGYNDDGSRYNCTVSFEVQYAPTGTQEWSVPTAGFQITNTQTLYANLSNTVSKRRRFILFDVYFTNTFIILDTSNGSVSLRQVTSDARWVDWPSLSSEEVVLGYIRGGYNLYYVDNHSALVGSYINSVNDFAVTCNFSNLSNVIISVSSGFIKGVSGTLTVTASTAQTLRKSKRFKFPTSGQYDVRIRRLTGDTDSDRILDKSFLTALKSISYKNPVKFANISGTAMRIKASDQLSGAVDTYNVIASTLLKGYNPDTGLWEDDRISSNPADIFRYVLQSPAFAKALPDSKIDIEKLEEWWVYCNETGLTYNRVIDYDTSVDDVLNDICAAGVATLSKANNIYSVIIDNERPIIKGMVTPRNSWDYKGNINYPELPHGLRIEFRNADKAYETDERIVYRDGYDENNATLYERLEFPSCTNADLAYWYGRRYFATALLQPETHTFKMDFESMTFNRGDRITLVNDVILVGVGQARIKELLVDNVDNPTIVQGFTTDDKLDIPKSINLAVRIRDNNISQGYAYHLLQSAQGVTDTFEFSTPVDYNNAPAVGSLCAFVEDGKELDLIITNIKPEKNEVATITAIDYAPARFDPIGVIPEFNSNITIPADYYQPYAPELVGDILTNEAVMIKNSDGSVTSVAIISLRNKNEDNVYPVINVRKRDTTEWFAPTTLKRDPDEIVITGLEDGVYYDFSIRYQRQTGLQLISQPLLIENVQFIGGSTPPSDVERFRVSVTNGLGLFQWQPVADVDVSHYVIKYTGSTQNVTWDNAQTAMDNIKGSSITNVIHKGTYLIKAVDYTGHESVNATVIVSNSSGAFENVVEEFVEDPNWNGVKDNIIKSGDLLELAQGVNEGYYYFENQSFDLGDIYTCSLTSNIYSVIESRNRIRDMGPIRDINYPIRNIVPSSDTSLEWYVELQMNLSDDGVNWKGWEEFTASQLAFRAIKFRLHVYCKDTTRYTPRVSICRVVVDMPDRYESGEDIEITNASTGATVIYESAFRNNPSVNITLQDSAVDDKIEFVTKNNEGFTIKVFNATLNSYVKRSFDFLSAGYGKVNQ